MVIPPPAERRLVSVLFADLVGFTSLSDSRDPEDVRELLTRYLDLAREVVARYGGTVDKFIGDAVVAVWGTPTAHEDDAERAVRTAFDLIDRVAAMGRELGASGLALRVAVGTGPAAVVVGAVGQGMVAGDLVNTTSRLQTVAEPGGVLADEGTYRAASRAIKFEPLADQSVKGKALPVRAWKAQQVVARRRGAGRGERLDAPFTGRDEELRVLKDLFHAAERERRLRLMSVVGQAGIGKSRLAWEFEKYIDGLAGDVYWHQGRSPAYGEGITFWALGEMVRRRAGIAETDDIATSRDRLASCLATYVPDETERRWLAPRLGALLGLDETPPGEREELFAAWRSFFERVADRGPTVMVFEDLQWADQGLFDFIQHLVEWSRPHPIFIITLARPELFERRPDWGAGLRNFTALHLEPLSNDDMGRLLSGLAPGLPAQLLEQIVTRAAGIPLYAVETVRMLLDDGRLIAQNGSYQVVGEVAQLAVPPTLHALIGARLDTLPKGECSLLQDAAVLGQTFTVAGLAALHRTTAEELEPRLRALVRKELLVHDADPRSPGRGQYGFVQALIREIAHERLSKSMRRERHLEAARYFESLDDDQLAGVVASHYLGAYQATSLGLEAESTAALARKALLGAAERAASLHSHDQALAYLEQALTITTDPAERAARMEAAATSAAAAARMDRAELFLGEVTAWHRQQAEPEGVARATLALARIWIGIGKPAAAIAALEPLLAERAGSEPDASVAALIAELARAYMLRGQEAPGLHWAERALAAAGPADQVPVIVEALITKGALLAHGQRSREGVLLLNGALGLAQAQGLVVSELRCRYNLVAPLLEDDPRGALQVARSGLDLARRLGLLERVFSMLSVCTSPAFHAGEWDWALSSVAEFDQERLPLGTLMYFLEDTAVMKAFRGEGAEEERRLGDLEPGVMASTSPQDIAWFLLTRAMLALAHGRPDEAHEFASSAAAAGADSAFIASYCFRTGTRAAIWLKDRQRAGESFAALSALRRRGRWAQLGYRTLAAGLAALDGKAGEAAAGYLEAASGWRELDVRLDLGLCQLEFATLLPEHASAPAAAEEAHQIFTGLRAASLLDRLHGGPNGPRS